MKTIFFFFHLKIIIYTVFKNLCIMHGNVCVMSTAALGRPLLELLITVGQPFNYEPSILNWPDRHDPFVYRQTGKWTLKFAFACLISTMFSHGLDFILIKFKTGLCNS